MTSCQTKVNSVIVSDAMGFVGIPKTHTGNTTFAGIGQYLPANARALPEMPGCVGQKLKRIRDSGFCQTFCQNILPGRVVQKVAGFRWAPDEGEWAATINN